MSGRRLSVWCTGIQAEGRAPRGPIDGKGTLFFRASRSSAFRRVLRHEVKRLVHQISRYTRVVGTRGFVECAAGRDVPRSIRASRSSAFRRVLGHEVKRLVHRISRYTRVVGTRDFVECAGGRDVPRSIRASRSSAFRKVWGQLSGGGFSVMLG